MDEKSSELNSVSEKNDPVEDMNSQTKQNEVLQRENKQKNVDKTVKTTLHASKKTLDSILHRESLSFVHLYFIICDSIVKISPSLNLLVFKKHSPSIKCPPWKLQRNMALDSKLFV
jgi:hypothetical protein